MRLRVFFVLVSLFGSVVSYGDISKLVDPLVCPGESIAVAAELPIIRKPSLQSPSTTDAGTGHRCQASGDSACTGVKELCAAQHSDCCSI